MSILGSVRDNGDLRSLPADKIPELCADIRDFLIKNVSRTGGHLASNLGVVELTVALHRVYDPYSDRILFDVGHQSYVHKMLTGRKEEFDTLRSFGGLSGFPSPGESKADPFLAGHASDAVSVAAGMARARTLLGEKYDVVAVLGDGAATGGLSYEGLCDLGASRERAVVILNDNGMSIKRNVGGIARLLSSARMKPFYFAFKRAYRRTLKNAPRLYLALHKIKEWLKHKLLPSGLFEDLGFEYLGPIDGHDEAALESAIRWAKELGVPVLVHVVTKKGKGYPPAEDSPDLYHGVDPFLPEQGVSASDKRDFSACFGQALTELAASDRRICAVTAAMEQGTGLESFAARYRDRFFELGIVEGHAVAMCAGMAKQGLLPVFAVYSSFLQRAYDMLLEDVGMMDTHVVLAVDRAGTVGRDGVTHQGAFDVAYLSSVPNMTLYAPASFAELRSMLKRALYHTEGPAAIRYPRGGEGEYTDDHSGEPCSVLRRGTDVTLVCHGILVNAVLRAAEELEKDGVSAEVVKINRIRPLDSAPVMDSLRRTGRLVAAEDACRAGSVGSRLLESAAAEGVCLRGARLLDMGSGVVPHGKPEELYRLLHLDAQGVVSAVKEVMLDEKAEA